MHKTKDSYNSDWINISITNDGLIQVTSSYNQEFINDLKYRVPAAAREWQKAKKSWLVFRNYDKIVVSLAKKYFEDIKLDPKLTQILDQKDIIAIASTLSEAKLKEIYKTLVKLFHPDVNPGISSELITIVNEYWEQIKAARGIK